MGTITDTEFWWTRAYIGTMKICHSYRNERRALIMPSIEDTLKTEHDYLCLLVQSEPAHVALALAIRDGINQAIHDSDMPDALQITC